MPAPLVSVLVAVHDGEPFVRTALHSVLRQSVSDLELIVVDDASRDGTDATLAALDDPRVRVLRNDEQLGLAGSLNRALDEARGRYVARMDADDAAFPDWLARCLVLLDANRGVRLVGAGVLDVDHDGEPREVHLLDAGRAAFRWRALFSAPVFHDTVVLARHALEASGLRYDAAFGESEDYDLWTRVLADAEGDCVDAPLVLHRLHPQQASRRRGELQRSLAQQVSARQIAALTPDLGGREATLARSVWLGADVLPDEVSDATDAFVELERRFEGQGRFDERELAVVRASAARSLVRLASAGGGTSALRHALRLDPLVPARVAALRVRRRSLLKSAGRDAPDLLRTLAASPDAPPIRVAAVFPEPTPYRAPLLDRVAALPEIDLTVLYAAGTVAGRTWRVEPEHRTTFLRGLRVPGAERVLHHDYPFTPGVVPALNEVRPDVVVVSGWSTFAAQAAIAWCRLRKVPYVLVVESHDEGPRPGWRRTVKNTVVPPVVTHASGVLVTGTLARNSMVTRGAPAERVRVFANTVDVEEFAADATRLAPRRPELRSALGGAPDDVLVLSVARLAPEKGLDVLVRAVAEAGDPRLLLVLAGDGAERGRLEQLARDLGVRLVLAGDVEWARIVELYVAADVFALLSEREPWAVVVNEAAACGLPLVLSDRVGAAHDLLRDGENGALVPAGDVGAAAAALRALAADPELRRAQGERSRELARDWGYGPSVEGFLEAVREAVADRG
ncbi:MAG TPA: glycosyltransferase [Gaiellaceae bacterium]|nr:glycosyltransferase [Gaiellaceae bacterium]